MKTINLNTGSGATLTLFPDNQPHINVGDIQEAEPVRVICSLTDSVKLLQLLQVSNALDNCFAQKKILVIPYLMAARYDRLMVKGDSIDIKVVADMINYCGFEKVILFDPHSEIAALLIHHAVVLTNKIMVEQYNREQAMVICPDAGAAKKVEHYFSWNSHLTDIVYCNKKRNVSTGHLVLEVLNPELCTNRNCVIIDDLCDGGATFLAIAEQIKPAHLTLIVTHGIFSKGLAALSQKFNQIIVSNSYSKVYDSPIVQTIAMEYNPEQIKNYI
jgi:ribose-phosphate pyrophosphokinase